MNIRNFHCAWGAAILLAVLPQAAAAQISGGRSGFSTQQSLGAHEYWDAVRYFGRCYAAVSQARAFALLATEPGSVEERSVSTRMMQGESNCIPGLSRMSFTVPHMRGAIAEGLLLLNAPLPPNLALAAPAEGATIRNISEAARCYAAAHEPEVRALLTGTRPGSAEEVTALEHMAPDFFRCVPPNARGYQFGATDVRYRLAEALLRLRPAAAPTRH